MQRHAARIAAYAAAAAVLAAALALYAHPAFLVALADVAWACFN